MANHQASNNIEIHPPIQNKGMSTGYCHWPSQNLSQILEPIDLQDPPPLPDAREGQEIVMQAIPRLSQDHAEVTTVYLS